MIGTLVRIASGAPSRAQQAQDATVALNVASEDAQYHRATANVLRLRVKELEEENARLEQDNENLQYENARLRGNAHLPTPRATLSPEEAAHRAREGLRVSMERRGW